MDYETAFWIAFPFAIFACFILASRVGTFFREIDEDLRRMEKYHNPMKDFRAKNGRRTP